MGGKNGLDPIEKTVIDRVPTNKIGADALNYKQNQLIKRYIDIKTAPNL